MTNVIASKDPIPLNKYLNDFCKLIEQLYNVNFLKINLEKKKLLIICKPNLQMLANNIKIKGNIFIIELLKSIKILGVFINNEFDKMPYVNKSCIVSFWLKN